MDDTPISIVSTAIEIFSALLIIAFIGSAITISSSLQKAYQREADISNQMEDYALYTKYDNTQLSGSDVIEAIFQYSSSDFVVRVDRSPLRHYSSGGTTFLKETGGGWELTVSNPGGIPVNTDNITFAVLNGQINVLDIYIANIRIGMNGNIVGITFD